MRPLRYLIVDDEAPSRKNLRLALAGAAHWACHGECADVASARRMLVSQEIDVVFLDIQMPTESGLVLARELSRLAEPPLVVFISAYSEHAIEAFELHALDYLLKPLDDARLARTLIRSEAMLQQRQRSAYGAALRDYVDSGVDGRSRTHVNVRSVGRIEQINISDILWIESAGNYVELQLAGRSVLYRATFLRVEVMLPPGEFIRVHRGVLVRCEQISSLSSNRDAGYRLTLRCGAIVAVSERYLTALKLRM